MTWHYTNATRTMKMTAGAGVIFLICTILSTSGMWPSRDPTKNNLQHNGYDYIFNRAVWFVLGANVEVIEFMVNVNVEDIKKHDSFQKLLGLDIFWHFSLVQSSSFCVHRFKTNRAQNLMSLCALIQFHRITVLVQGIQTERSTSWSKLLIRH